MTSRLSLFNYSVWYEHTYGVESRLMLLACVDDADLWFVKAWHTESSRSITWSTRCPMEDGRTRVPSAANMELQVTGENRNAQVCVCVRVRVGYLLFISILEKGNANPWGFPLKFANVKFAYEYGLISIYMQPFLIDYDVSLLMIYI